MSTPDDNAVPREMSRWERVSSLISPLLYCAFVAWLFFSNGFRGLLRFAAEYFGFMGRLLLGSAFVGAVLLSIKFVLDASQKRWGEINGVIIMFLYVLVGLPMLFTILDVVFKI